MIIERTEDSTRDCARPIHQGTYQPAVASYVVAGVPLCEHHFRAELPAAEPAP